MRHKLAKAALVAALLPVLLGSGLPSALAAPGRVVPRPAAVCTRTCPQFGFSGYSAYPSGGYIVDQSADWTVPQVTCPASVAETPRAAVWVGMWGSQQALASQTGWLPQIGTVSLCNEHGIYGPSYSIAWEMYSQQGYGNAGQFGLDCPGDATYSLCGYNYDGTPATSVTISPGDQINAAVAFLGPYTNGLYARGFELRLNNLSTGQYAIGDVYTSQPVQISQISVQGGTIVENKPPCRLRDIFHFPPHCYVLANNGLAEFDTPVQVTGMVTLTGQGGQGNLVPLHYTQWVMKLDNGDLLASNSPPTGSARGDKQGLSYAVTWLRQY